MSENALAPMERIENAILVIRGQKLLLDTHLAALFGSYNNRPAAQNPLSQYRNLLHHYVHQRSQEEASTFWGACGAVRRSVFLKLGGFDQQYRRPSIEDIELGYRMKSCGYRIRLVKGLQVTHLKQWTFRSIILTDIRDRAIPWTKLLIARPSLLANDLNLATSARYSTLLVLLLILAPLALPLSLWFAAAILLCVFLLCWINRHFYGFLRRLRGNAFLLRAIPMHWLYFLYSGIVFSLVSLRTIASFGGLSLLPPLRRLWFR